MPTGIIDLFSSVPKNILESASIAWGGADGFQDAETALLIDEGDERSLFLEVLHYVLIRGITDLNSSVNRHKLIEGDLVRWFNRVPEEDALVFWLKVAVERFPMRLFVICDWTDQEALWSGEDAFWFDLQEDQKTATIEEGNRGVNGVWRTPDPRPWKGPNWRRFLGKRICWLKRNDVADILKNLIANDSKIIISRHLLTISPEGVEKSLELFPLWLRLKWTEHLARRVRGLDWSYSLANTHWPPYGALRIILDLLTDEHSSSYRPSTLPPIQADAESTQAETHYLNDGHVGAFLYLSRAAPFPKPYDKTLGVELHWTGGGPRVASAIMTTHQELFEKDDVDDSWNRNGFAGEEVSPWVIFAGALSGALVSHNSLAALSHDSGSQGAAWRLLEVIEQSLVRVAVCDERVQEWWERGSLVATNGIQRRVYSLFWEEQGAWNQGEVPAHGFSGQLGNVGGRWEVELRGPDCNDDLLQKLFQDDPWPVSADLLLVHQGILDKWEKKKGRDFTAAPAEELMSLKDEIPWLIVTSGRGKPERVSKGVRFLPLSGLQACLVGNRFDKLLLVRQLAACGGEI